MSRTILDFTPEGLKRRLADMERQLADIQRRGDWRYDTEVDPEASSLLLRNNAQLLVMSATGDSIASGGDYVTFATIVDQHSFTPVAAAGQSWTHPVSGVYVLTYEHHWDTYDGGGTLELEIDGVILRTFASGAGQDSLDVIGYYTDAGRIGKIKVTQSSGSAQTCDAIVQVLISDPAVTAAGTWAQVATSDVYDLTLGGSTWWTTEGSSGMTVSQRTATWAETSSFEATAIDTGGAAGPVRGITHDGTNLWVVGEKNTAIVRFSTAGGVVSQFDPVWGGETGMVGIAHDGTDLWVVGNTTEQLRRYSTTGVLGQTESLPTSNEVNGCAFYDGRIFIVDNTDARLLVYRITTDAFESEIDVSGATSSPTGVWISGTGQLYVSEDGVGVWLRSTVVT